MKKTFKVVDLDCAHCAAKMEDGIRKLDGVNEASVNFMAQKLTIDAADDRFDEVLQEAIKIIGKIEPDCKVVVK